MLCFHNIWTLLLSYQQYFWTFFSYFSSKGETLLIFFLGGGVKKLPDIEKKVKKNSELFLEIRGENAELLKRMETWTHVRAKLSRICAKCYILTWNLQNRHFFYIFGTIWQSFFKNCMFFYSNVSATFYQAQFGRRKNSLLEGLAKWNKKMVSISHVSHFVFFL